jgi:hypothetical protein
VGGLPPKRARRAVNKAACGFASDVRRAVEKSCPAQRPRERGGTRPLTPTQRAREVLLALQSLRDSLLRARVESTILQGRAHKLVVGNLRNLLPIFRGALHDDEVGLWRLCTSEEPRAVEGLEAAFRDDPDCDDQRSHLDEMFGDPKRIG